MTNNGDIEEDDNISDVGEDELSDTEPVGVKTRRVVDRLEQSVVKMISSIIIIIIIIQGIYNAYVLELM